MKTMNMHRLQLGVDEFRKLDALFPVQAITTFLYITMHPGCTLRLIERDCGISQASASRNVALLGKYHRTGKKGHDLVLPEIDFHDSRKHILNLTPKGRKIAETLSALMEG